MAPFIFRLGCHLMAATPGLLSNVQRECSIGVKTDLTTLVTAGICTLNNILCRELSETNRYCDIYEHGSLISSRYERFPH
ncbi:unnamed protein product [Arctia plantaginis]|uniref:Secreted protein n=1 Tax=Arctia plantaginis TaxID=874455 RepID=A0A8S1A3Y0_ARCPL|nr:unnamed protein product [Arctia plantaginis]